MTDSLRALEGSLVLGRYRIVKPLARGGMGMVYLGRVEGAAGFAKPVVIKRVLSQMDEEEASRAQFIREARILASLQHPNIVGVIDFAQEGDSYLMILEYVHGYHLGNWLRYARKKRGLIHWELSIYVVLKILAALNYAHNNNGPDGTKREIIHRDISPGNVLIDLEGNVRLLDFGIAVDKGANDEFKTQDGVVKGKLPYIAPEMYRSASASVSSDCYAAGVVLYQLLSGSNPFSDRDMSSIVRRVLEVDPPPISSLRDDVPAEMDEIVATAIAKTPEERFTDAQEFAGALHSLLKRSEGEIATDFRETIREDFGEEMAELLKLEPLSELDHAWRTAIGSGAKENSLLHSSLPPAPDLDSTSIVRAPHAGEVSEETYVDPRMRPRERESKGVSSKAMIFGMLGAAVLAAGVAVGAVLLTSDSKTPPKEPRFLLVERPGQNHPPAAAPDPPAEPTAPPSGTKEVDVQGTDEEGPATPPPSTSPAAPQPAGGDSSALTAAFARRQNAIQSCFSKNADSVQGSPRVSIRFQVAESGQVTGASLQPRSLSGTALGGCLLAVARSTKFPTQQKPVTFSIPITAQISQ